MMLELTPTCEAMLSACRWRGRDRNCSQLFSSRTTMDGYCCVFNYLRYDDFLSKEQMKILNATTAQAVRRLTATGFSMGLTFAVDAQPWDYFYPLLPFHGVKVLVFNPHEFADAPSGGVVEELVSLHKDSFLRLDAVTLRSTDAVRGFSLQQRRCLFESEVEDFAGNYGYSDCLMDCRAVSMRELCGCLSFFIPKRGDVADCGLRDVPCLARYTNKWRTLRPPQRVPGLEVEFHEALECPQCYPSCNDITYSMQSTYSVLRPEDLVGDRPAGNRSVVNIFYGTPNTLLLEQDELFSWYDLLGYFGGVCGLFVGFSLVSVVEAVYFCTFRLVLACKSYGAAAPAPAAAAPASVAANAPGSLDGFKANIYWREVVTDDQRF